MITTIIGNMVSPYVRKVIAVCAVKGVEIRLDPIIPFFGTERFTAVSPLRRIPVLMDDQVTLSDSSVICQYLEDRYPSPPVYPKDIADRAQARWLEEYADTRMGDVFIWRVFNEAVIKPGIWHTPRDLATIERHMREDVPDVLRYLESVAPVNGFAFGPLSIADISVSVFFDNLRWSRVEPDWAQWPRTQAWITRVAAEPVLHRLSETGDTLVRTPPDRQRAVYAEAGFGLTEETVGGAKPLKGPMSV